MKALVKNVSGGLLNLPNDLKGSSWPPGAEREINIPEALISLREELGYYKVISKPEPKEAPPTPKKTTKKRAVSKPKTVAHSAPGKSPALSEMLK